MAPRVKLSKKQQAEYDILKKRFRITKREYKEYYDEVRKANRKLQALNRKNRLLVPQAKYTTNIEMIKSRKMFNQRRQKFSNVLKRNFARERNMEARKNFIKSVYRVYSKSMTPEEFQEIVQTVNQMTDSQLADFINNNPELYKYFQKYVEYVILENISTYGEIDKSAILSRLKYSRDYSWGRTGVLYRYNEITDEMLLSMIDETLRQM